MGCEIFLGHDFFFQLKCLLVRSTNLHERCAELPVSRGKLQPVELIFSDYRSAASRGFKLYHGLRPTRRLPLNYGQVTIIAKINIVKGACFCEGTKDTITCVSTKELVSNIEMTLNE